MNELMLDWDSWNVPPHTRDTIENYLIRGLQPGGFVTAVMENDFVRATIRCDHINREALADIARWVMVCAPSSAWGSRKIVEDWIHDVNGVRTTYASAIEKQYIWKKLQQSN